MNIHVHQLGARASALNASLDVAAAPQIKDIENYKKFMQETIHYPTIGLIAKDTFVNSQPKNNPISFFINKRMVDKLDEIKKLKTDLSTRMDFMYPKTSKARYYIVNSGRISLDYVKPSKGYKVIDKLKMLLK